MAKPGPKTELTDELFKEIKKCILEGKDLRNTAKIIGIDKQKLYNWHYLNYLNISDKIANWKLERKLNLANRNIEEFLEMSDKNLKQVGEELIEFKDPALTRIKADMSKFVAETVGKDHYSKRVEQTGANGTPLIPNDKHIDTLASAINKELKSNVLKGTSEPSNGSNPD